MPTEFYLCSHKTVAPTFKFNGRLICIHNDHIACLSNYKLQNLALYYMYHPKITSQIHFVITLYIFISTCCIKKAILVNTIMCNRKAQVLLLTRNAHFCIVQYQWNIYQNRQLHRILFCFCSFRFVQGQTWDDGCSYKCRCDDASRGVYTCNERYVLEFFSNVEVIRGPTYIVVVLLKSISLTLMLSIFRWRQYVSRMHSLNWLMVAIHFLQALNLPSQEVACAQGNR